MEAGATTAARDERGSANATADDFFFGVGLPRPHAVRDGGEDAEADSEDDEDSGADDGSDDDDADADAAAAADEDNADDDRDLVEVVAAAAPVARGLFRRAGSPALGATRDDGDDLPPNALKRFPSAAARPPSPPPPGAGVAQEPAAAQLSARLFSSSSAPPLSPRSARMHIESEEDGALFFRQRRERYDERALHAVPHNMQLWALQRGENIAHWQRRMPGYLRPGARRAASAGAAAAPAPEFAEEMLTSLRKLRRYSIGRVYTPESRPSLYTTVAALIQSVREHDRQEIGLLAALGVLHAREDFPEPDWNALECFCAGPAALHAAARAQEECARRTARHTALLPLLSFLLGLFLVPLGVLASTLLWGARFLRPAASGATVGLSLYVAGGFLVWHLIQF